MFEIDPETGARTASEIDGSHVVCDGADPAACEAGVARPWITFMEITEDDTRLS